MRNVILYILVFLPFVAHTQSQGERLDSLKKILPNVKGIQKLQVMSDISEVYMLLNEIEKFRLNQAKLGKELSKYPNSANEVRQVFYCNEGVYFMSQADYKNVIIYLEKAINVPVETKKGYSFRVLAYINLAEMLKGLKEFQEALNYLNLAEQTAKKEKLKYYNIVSVNYYKAKIYDKLYELAKNNKSKDTTEYREKAFFSHNLVFQTLKNTNLKPDSESLRWIQLFDSTAQGLYAYGKKKEGQELFDKGALFLLDNGMIGYYYRLKIVEFNSRRLNGNLDKSGLENLLKDVNYTLENQVSDEDLKSYYEILYIKGEIYNELNQRDQAINNFQLIYDNIKNEPDNFYFFNSLCYNLGLLYENKQDYKKAVLYLKQSNESTNEIINEDSFQQEKMSKTVLEIERMKQAKQLEFEKVKSERNFNYAIILLLGFVLSIVILILLFIYNRNLKTKQKLLITEVNYNKEVALNSELDAIYQIKHNIQNQKAKAESEKQVAKNLHDDLASGLAAMNHFIKDKVSFATTEKDKKAFVEVNEEVNALYENVRNYIHNLYNQNEHHVQSVNEYLYDLIKKNDFSNSIKYTIDADFEKMDSKLNVFQQNQLYRIIKETIVNSLKYSQAKNIAVKIEIDKDECKFSVSDDGIGFKENVVMGIGLKNIEERIKALKGKFYIKTEKYKGVNLSGNFTL